MKIPAGHQAVMPYLILSDAEGFIEFTITVFDATLNFKRMRDDESAIMHAEVNINGSTVMCAGGTSEWEPMPGSLFVYVTDADEIYKRAVAQGAATIMAPDTKDYGRTCGVKDSFGNTWWITSVS